MHFTRTIKKSSSAPVVPMIDILFILLIFFIVSTNFKKPRTQMMITLPMVKDLPTQQEAKEMSVLAINADGVIDLEGAIVPAGLLDSYLSSWRKINPNGNIEVEADEKAPFGKMIEVWGALNKLGIEVMPTRAKASK
jgi:biopolymer transport protein ExbD